MKPIKTYFLDTNILVSHLDFVKTLEHFKISSVTLSELEDIKTSNKKTEDVRYGARQATHYLDENTDKYDVIIYTSAIEDYIHEKEVEVSPDTKIMASCAFIQGLIPNEDELIFATNDLACKNIAKQIFRLEVESVGEDNNYIYKGYKLLKGTTKEINNYMGNIDFHDWYTNEYIIIQNTDDNSEKEMRFDGEKFVSLKLPPSKYIKGKNALQRCALDILNNPDITIAAILGGYGSGKTYLSMQMALYNVQEKGRASKILGVREVTGEGKEIGYLPGDVEDKVGRFFDPLTQSLNGGEFELQSLKMSGVLDINTPFFMKGTTYNETIIICDEAEDLKENQIRLIGTRLGTNSKIYLAGDYKQSLLTKTSNNPLIKMCNEFKGNEKFSCIYLGEDVRSETSKMFAELFEG